MQSFEADTEKAVGQAAVHNRSPPTPGGWGVLWAVSSAYCATHPTALADQPVFASP